MLASVFGEQMGGKLPPLCRAPGRGAGSRTVPRGATGSGDMCRLVCCTPGSSGHSRFCSLPALGLRTPPRSQGGCTALLPSSGAPVRMCEGTAGCHPAGTPFLQPQHRGCAAVRSRGRDTTAPAGSRSPSPALI